MAELNIDIDKAAEKIANETHLSINMAYTDAKALKNYHHDLFPIIEAWLDGEEREFEFMEVSLSYIMQKERCCYFSSLSRMSVLLKKPDSVERYKNRVFRWK